MAIKQDRLIDFNPAAVVELPDAKPPKALVWADERVTEWSGDFQRQLTAERARRGNRSFNMVGVYISTPRPSPVMVWTPAQTSAFLAQASAHRLYALYRLIALRGLRRGEAVGLRWKDVNLKASHAAAIPLAPTRPRRRP
ncbi:hypothetical protein [Microtetraspora malaysiensis]|uniref:hypothetical protein n=1 Tax=Microtetraspora malaysiensis TaxID=161358 RepID=UPI003D91EBBF